ncbi:MAG: DUF4129 domain-containing protein [Acidimicrobiales bacterium]
MRDLADQILSQPRYDVPPKSIPERITSWLGDQLSRLLDALGGGGELFGTVVAWAILLGILAAVVYLLVRYGRVTLPSLPADPEPEVMVELTRTAREWRDEADALEADGRWEEGLRCRYRALVADLVRRGVIADQAGRTAGEHARDVAAREPDAAPSFAAATELFEAVWYGGSASGAAEAERFRALDARVLAVRT